MDFLNKLGIDVNETISDQTWSHIEKIEKQLFTVYDLPTPTPTPEELGLPEGTEIQESSGQRIYDSKGRELGNTGRIYKSLQPIDFLTHIVDQVNKVGADNILLNKLEYKEMKDGKLINFRIPTDVVTFKNRAGNKEEIALFLNFETGFGGNFAQELGMYSHRFRCSNGLLIADYVDRLKCKNTENNHIKLMLWTNEIVAKINQVKHLSNVWQAMDKVEVTSKQIKEFADMIAGVKKDETLENMSTRKKNILESVNTALETELKDAGKTLWGMLQGATRYTNHLASGANEEYIIAATGKTINDNAQKHVNKLLQLA